MLPSLRISYLVLPEKLLTAYEAIADRYNQTSSTVEQLALAAYIEEGHLTRHIRKLRSLYRTKSRRLKEELTSRFGSKVRLLSYGSGLHLHIALDLPGTAEELARKALAQGSGSSRSGVRSRDGPRNSCCPLPGFPRRRSGKGWKPSGRLWRSKRKDNCLLSTR